VNPLNANEMLAFDEHENFVDILTIEEIGENDNWTAGEIGPIGEAKLPFEDGNGPNASTN
jgi:hypothetical protein